MQIQNLYQEINWTELQKLAAILEKPGINPSEFTSSALEPINAAISAAVEAREWDTLIRLRKMFTALLARDTLTGNNVLHRLEQEALVAAERANNKVDLADFVGAYGHNLHRQGLHQKAIENFNRAADLYIEIDKKYYALRNTFMIALCERALGRNREALRIVDHVLLEVPREDPWRAHPLQVRAWLLRDIGHREEAEKTLRHSIDLLHECKNSEINIAGALADLGELVGQVGRIEEAKTYFEKSLEILGQFEGQFQRQEARTKIKQAELLIREGRYNKALIILNEVDDILRSVGSYYDLTWKLELARGRALFWTGRFSSALDKFWLAFSIRKDLSLSPLILVRQAIGHVLGRTRAILRGR